MNNPSIMVGFPLSNDTEFITRHVWEELSRELEDKYPAVHLWLYRLYRIPMNDGKNICLRVGGIEAFEEANYEILGKGVVYAQSRKCKIYLRLVPTLKIETVQAPYFHYNYYERLQELDPLIAQNIGQLLQVGLSNGFYNCYELYKGWDVIFDYTIRSLSNKERFDLELSKPDALVSLVLSNQEKLRLDQKKLKNTLKSFTENPIEFYIKAQEALDEYRRVNVQYKLASEELRLRK